MLANIHWANEFDPNNGFESTYGQANAVVARQLVNRAIADWEAVITSFNFAEDSDADPNNDLNDTFTLNVIADSTISSMGDTSVTFTNGKPTSATVRIDDNGQDTGWYFDPTPLDDAEFTAIANSGENVLDPAFHGSFVDIGGGESDFYRTVLQEIGHALGLVVGPAGTALATNSGWMTDAGVDPGNGFARLYTFHRPDSPNEVTATLTTAEGGHLFEGNHPNDLMNSDRALEHGPVLRPTTRQLISDWNARILEDAYGYSVVLPSSIDSMHATLDSQTGTLLVQGGVNTAGEARTDDIQVRIVDSGARIRVRVNGTTEFFQRSDVSQMIIATNGGGEVPDVAAELDMPGFRQDVHFVVSSNFDSDNASARGDNFVDQDLNVPGKQIALRAAIVDANSNVAPEGIGVYVPRGTYNLTRRGAGEADQVGGDLDINRFVIVVGSGAGSTNINAGTLALQPSPAPDRVFEVQATGALEVSRLTVTGGVTVGDGGGIRVNDNPTLGVRELTLREVAVTFNRATNVGGFGNGGGIYFGPNTAGVIERSVITDNYADEVASEGGGGGIYAAEAGATVRLSETTVALNNAALGPDLLSILSARFVSEGGNLVANTSGATFAAPGLQSSDYTNQTPGFVAPNYVVTSRVDDIDRSDDSSVRSIRDAVFQTNAAANQTIWLPAWDFVLTRRRTAAAGMAEMDSDDGDIDIKESLSIRSSGAPGGGATIGWQSGLPNDAIFDLLGDFSDAVQADHHKVSSADYTIWRDMLGAAGEDLAADADDDGNVDQHDRAIWKSHFGNTLRLEGVAVG